jgi:MSHA pilin protein MshC
MYFRQSGVSLLELLTVVMLLSVLSVYAVPRMTDNSAFFARGFHDETLSLLRYSQKTAIVQRRSVCVDFTDTSAQLSIASVSGGACDTALASPAQNCEQVKPLVVKACIQAHKGISYSPTPGPLIFDGLGQPNSGSQFVQVAVGGTPISSRIVIEDPTGYVHDQKP